MPPLKTSSAPSRLRQLREAQGLTPGQLAARVGTSRQQISYLELGQRRLTTDWLVRLAEALGCHPWTIVSEIVTPGPGGDFIQSIGGDPNPMPVRHEREAVWRADEISPVNGIGGSSFRRQAANSRPDKPDAHEFQSLQDENRRLKTLLADSMLDISSLKDLLERNRS